MCGATGMARIPAQNRAMGALVPDLEAAHRPMSWWFAAVKVNQGNNRAI